MGNYGNLLNLVKHATHDDLCQQLLEDYSSELCHLRSFANEVVLSDEQQRQACAARKDGDAIQFAKIWDEAIQAWADEEIEAVADNYGYELWQAAKHLCRVHHEPQQAAA